jgi:hypothetical protein
MPEAETTHCKISRCRDNLGVLGVRFQFNLFLALALEPQPLERGVDRIEQPGGLEVVESGQVAPAL